jgi:hypothetical protein
MSARFMACSTSFEAECKSVTVLSIPFLVINNPSGRPTVIPRPIMATSAPLVGTLYLLSNSIIPAGVQGSGEAISPETPSTSFPRFSGCRPSASFAGSTSSNI